MDYKIIKAFTHGIGLYPVSDVVYLSHEIDIEYKELYKELSDSSDIIFAENLEWSGLEWIIPRFLIEGKHITLLTDFEQGIPKLYASRIAMIMSNIDLKIRKFDVIKNLSKLRKNDLIIIQDNVKINRKFLFKNNGECPVAFDMSSISCQTLINDGIYDLIPVNLSFLEEVYDAN